MEDAVAWLQREMTSTISVDDAKRTFLSTLHQEARRKPLCQDFSLVRVARDIHKYLMDVVQDSIAFYWLRSRL